MKQPIKQLAEQAGIGYGNLSTGHGDNWQFAGRPEELERFAQLIVKECVQEVEGMAILMDAGHDQWNRAIGHTVLHLKEHFGVEQ